MSENERRALDGGITKLKSKIETYEHDGVCFEKICNDNSVKYDILGNGYYTVKLQSREIPLRVLYKFKRGEDNEFTLEVHKAHIKKYNNKNYIRLFENYAACHV